MRLAVLAAIALATALSGARAESVSEIPYAVLHGVLAPAQIVAAYPRLRALQRIESRRAGVAPSAIRLEILARDGTIAVPVSADGVIEFPISEALLAENPPVRSNQPKGSLSLSVTLALAPPAGTRVAVADLVAALADVDVVLAQLPADAGRRVRGVEFRFDPRAMASATLRGASERLLLADAAGRVVLMRDTDLGTGATEIELSEAPRLVLPYLKELPR